MRLNCALFTSVDIFPETPFQSEMRLCSFGKHDYFLHSISQDHTRNHSVAQKEWVKLKDEAMNGLDETLELYDKVGEVTAEVTKRDEVEETQEQGTQEDKTSGK